MKIEQNNDMINDHVSWTAWDAHELLANTLCVDRIYNVEPFRFQTKYKRSFFFSRISLWLTAQGINPTVFFLLIFLFIINCMFGRIF